MIKKKCFYSNVLLITAGVKINLKESLKNHILQREPVLKKELEENGYTDFFLRYFKKNGKITETAILCRIEGDNLIGLEAYTTKDGQANEIEAVLKKPEYIISKKIDDEQIETINEDYKKNGSELEVLKSNSYVDFVFFLDRTLSVNKDNIIEIIDLKVKEKKEILESIRVGQYKNLDNYFETGKNFTKEEQRKIAELKSEIIEKKEESFEKTELRILRDKIDKKLNDEDEEDETVLEKKIEASKAPEEIKKKLKKELRKAKRVGQGPEYATSISYVEECLLLPWETKEEETTLEKAKEILDSTHYGLDKVKERILEILAIKKLRKTNPTILLGGAPGVGKTTVAASIAKALGREFVKISLGGVSDEAEIRGHRKTYVGAMCGMIMKGLQKASTRNPVVLLDEIDKITKTGKGDPEAALLEVLDPGQNKNFKDHFVEFEYDLSECLFICTANYLERVSEPLLDRAEIIDLEMYTLEEKVEIAKRHLIAKALKETGLENIKLNLDEETIKEIIEKYTREAGVRELERCFLTICSKLAVEFIKKEFKAKTIKIKDLEKYLGNEKFQKREKDTKLRKIGAVNGLAWTQVGGKVLDVQAVGLKTTSTPSVKATGNLQNVMKESTEVALTFLKTISTEEEIKKDFYLHFPAAATPKDGPSAGITIATALYSVIHQKPVRQDIAMTGEISILGEILPIGGVKEKVSGAYKLGIKEIILPKLNELDAKEISKEIRNDIKIHFVETFEEAKNIIFN